VPLTPNLVIKGWKYHGCANELSAGRGLSGATTSDSTTMIIEMCLDYCTERNFPLAGSSARTSASAAGN
jgi:hypothetical protein